MQTKAIRSFIYSSAVLLSVTSIAKLVSAHGNARLLRYDDAILALPFRDILWMTGLLELAIAAALFIQ